MKAFVIPIVISITCLISAVNADFSEVKPKPIEIKVALTRNNNTWEIGGKMPVTVEIKNISGVDLWLDMHSIRFHLTTIEGDNWTTYLVSNEVNMKWLLPIKKGESAVLNYDLSELTMINFAKFADEFTQGKYKLTAMVQIHETEFHHGKKLERLRGFDSSILINLSERKGKNI